MKVRIKSRQIAILSVCSLALFSQVAALADIKPRAARSRQTEVITELNSKGKELAAKYSKMLEAVISEVKSSATSITDPHKVTLVAALTALAEATNSLRAAEIDLARNQSTIAGDSVKAAEADIKVAPVILAARQEQLEWAKALPDSREDKAELIKFAEGQITNRTRDLENAPRNLERAQSNLEKAKAEEAKLKAALPEALATYEKTLAEANQALGATAANGFLASDKLDGKFALYKILSDGTPRGLA